MYETYVINLDGYKSVGTYLIALHVNGNTITYFDSFGVKHIPKEINKFIGNRITTANIYRTLAYHSIMYGHFYKIY